MGLLDIILLVLILIGGYRGFKKGLLMELIALGSIFLAVILSMRFMPIVSDFIGRTFPALGAAIPLTSFVVVFIGVLILLNFAGKSLKKVLDLTLLGSLDDVMGMVVGVLKVSVVLSFIIWTFNNLLGEFPEGWIGESVIFPYIKMLAPWLIDTFSFLFPYVEDIKEKIKDFSTNKDVLTEQNIKLCLQSII